MVSGSDRGYLLSAADLREVCQLAGHVDVVNTVAFSPENDHVITGSDDGTVRLWGVGESIADGADLASGGVQWQARDDFTD